MNIDPETSVLEFIRSMGTLLNEAREGVEEPDEQYILELTKGCQTHEARIEKIRQALDETTEEIENLEADFTEKTETLLTEIDAELSE